MTHPLRPRTLPLKGGCHLLLEPDPDHRDRLLVRFCGLARDRVAIAATEQVRVRLMLGNLRGETAYGGELPERVTLGWLDRKGWHLGGSPYAAPLAALPLVRARLDELLDDLMLRVALIAAAERPEPPGGADR